MHNRFTLIIPLATENWTVCSTKPPLLRSTLGSTVLNGNAKISSFLLQDIDGLEVIGANKPRALVTECCGPIQQKAEEEKGQTNMKNANL